MPVHAERKFMPYSPEQLYALVADIEKYPEFLPWCVGVRVRRREESRTLADMMIGYKMFRERFTSLVTFDRPQRIDVQYFDGPFKQLNNHWIFRPQSETSCEIDFYIDFEFRSAMLQKVIGAVFNEAVRRMVSSFEKRAHTLYG